MASIPYLKKKLKEKYFNPYIRLRDVMANGYGRCISCNAIKHYSDLDAGHFISVGSCGALEFDEMNVHAQCQHCNRFNSGDAKIVYFTNLERKIGRENLDRLMAMSKTTHKWSSWELEELIKIYKAKFEELRSKKII